MEREFEGKGKSMDTAPFSPKTGTNSREEKKKEARASTAVHCCSDRRRPVPCGLEAVKKTIRLWREVVRIPSGNHRTRSDNMASGNARKLVFGVVLLSAILRIILKPPTCGCAGFYGVSSRC